MRLRKMLFDGYKLALFLFWIFSYGTSAGSHSDWSYEGDTGPDHWGDHFPICNKRRQSPINIRTEDVTDKDLGQITFVRYHKPVLGMKLKNNGHAAQVDITDGLAYIKKSDLVGRRFKLAQFHFHWGKDSSQGSEHTHDNKAYPAEMHLVHFNTKYESLSEAADKRNGLAVLGVFIEVGQTDNKAFSDIINNLQKVNQPGTETDIPSIQLDKLLPINTDDYFRYRGSLTTPPCYQSVQWTVFKQPVYLSESQLGEFRKLKDSKGQKLVDNFRPVQPLRVRAVFSDYSRP